MADVTAPTTEETAGLRAALADARDAVSESADASNALARAAGPQTVDAGWRSRKLIVGVTLGALVILLASGLMLVAVTGIWVRPEIAAQLVRLDPKYWVLAVGAGLGFVALCLGLISVDKILDLAREMIPVIKAKYGIKGSGR